MKGDDDNDEVDKREKPIIMPIKSNKNEDDDIGDDVGKAERERERGGVDNASNAEEKEKEEAPMTSPTWPTQEETSIKTVQRRWRRQCRRSHGKKAIMIIIIKNKNKK